MITEAFGFRSVALNGLPKAPPEFQTFEDCREEALESMKRLRRWDHKSVGVHKGRSVRWTVFGLERVAGTEMVHKTSVPKDGTDQCVVERTGEDRKSLPDSDGYCRLLIVQSPAVAGLITVLRLHGLHMRHPTN